MPRAKVFYFSGTGNTWALARLYGEELERIGYEAELVAIDALHGAAPTVDADLLLLGYPVHAWNLPFIVRDFVASLPPGEGRHAAAFMTMGGNSRGAVAITWQLLADKGYQVLSVQDYIMPTNYVVGGKAGTAEAFQALLAEASPVVRGVVADLVAGRAHPVEFVDAEIEFSETTYARYSGAFPKFAQSFQVSAGCTLCNLCVELCPTANLRVQDRTVAYGDKCVFCLRCINLCPERAIEWRDKTQDVGRYQAPGFAKAIRTLM